MMVYQFVVENNKLQKAININFKTKQLRWGVCKEVINIKGLFE